MQNISAKCEFRHFQQAIQEGQAIKEEVIIKSNQSDSSIFLICLINLVNYPFNQSVYFRTLVTFIVSPTAILEQAVVTNVQGWIKSQTLLEYYRLTDSN